jgi:hypothetical protein
MQDMLEVTSLIRPSLVVLTAHRPERFAAVGAQLSALAALAPLALAGAGATEEVARAAGARRLEGDAVTSAESLVGS